MTTRTTIAAASSFVLVASAAIVSLWLVRPPAAVPLTAPEMAFSSARAM